MLAERAERLGGVAGAFGRLAHVVHGDLALVGVVDGLGGVVGLGRPGASSWPATTSLSVSGRLRRGLGQHGVADQVVEGVEQGEVALAAERLPDPVVGLVLASSRSELSRALIGPTISSWSRPSSLRANRSLMTSRSRASPRTVPSHLSSSWSVLGPLDDRLERLQRAAQPPGGDAHLVHGVLLRPPDPGILREQGGDLGGEVVDDDLAGGSRLVSARCGSGTDGRRSAGVASLLAESAGSAPALVSRLPTFVSSFSSPSSSSASTSRHRSTCGSSLKHRALDPVVGDLDQPYARALTSAVTVAAGVELGDRARAGRRGCRRRTRSASSGGTILVLRVSGWVISCRTPLALGSLGASRIGAAPAPPQGDAPGGEPQIRGVVVERDELVGLGPTISVPKSGQIRDLVVERNVELVLDLYRHRSSPDLHRYLLLTRSIY